jgi:hypothetical protein
VSQDDGKADLLSSLREAVDYATTAGLLKDANALATLDAAESARRDGQAPDLKAVSQALNDMVALIAPLTLADLHFHRNPLSRENQARTRMYQFWLPVMALLTLLLIGYLMQSLRQAQSFVARVEQVQSQHPEQRLAALQQMVLVDKLLAASTSRPGSSVRVQYLEKLSEMQRLNDELVALSALADDWVSGPGDAFSGLSSLPPEPQSDPGAAAAADSAGGLSQTGGTGQAGNVASSTATPLEATEQGSTPVEESTVLCEGKDGELLLPDRLKKLPQWMQEMAFDDLRTFCFRLQLAGSGSRSMPEFKSILSKLGAAMPTIKDKIRLRSEWLLPFLYGLLGSMLFVMRTIGNIRLPAMHDMSILMRIALGGMAGIVVGWFSIGDPGATAGITSAIAWPFVLAFVTGYGIEALFSVLDRMNRIIADTTYPKREAGTGTP